MEELELRGRSGMLTPSDGGAYRNFTVEDLIGADFRVHYTDDLDTDIAGSVIRHNSEFRLNGGFRNETTRVES
jgi:hypothetical protein